MDQDVCGKCKGGAAQIVIGLFIHPHFDFGDGGIINGLIADTI